MSAQAGKPNITLTGTVTEANAQTYLMLPFEVPAGITRLTVDLAYTGHEQHTNIDMGVFDTHGFRGWSGGNKHSFTISASDATPSYLPGRIDAGRWQLILGVPNIENGIQSVYTAKIYFAQHGDTPTVSTFSDAPIRNTPGWYRGDLHMHDAHSDGSCLSQTGVKVPCPLFKTVQTAAERKLDFIAMSDHNTVSHFNDMRELQPYFDNMLLIPAREITTFYGHANVFGTTDFVDFRLGSDAVPNVNAMMRNVENLHAIFSINHPGSPTGAICMGCGWNAPDTDYRLVRSIEIMNGGSLDGRYSGIPFWQDKLNRGYRITGIGGSDNHNADISTGKGSAIGHPTTVVYAENLSERTILDGIRAGHVFVDVEGSPDRAIEFSATTSDASASMGDAIKAPLNSVVHFSVKTTALAGDHIEAICDGISLKTPDDKPLSSAAEMKTFDYRSDGQRHWLRVNVRAADGSLLIAGNPIYLNL